MAVTEPAEPAPDAPPAPDPPRAVFEGTGTGRLD